MLLSQFTSRALRHRRNLVIGSLAVAPLVAIGFKSSTLPSFRTARSPVDFAYRRYNTSMSSTMASLSPSQLGNYEILTDFKLEYAPVNIIKLRSRKTGLEVVVGQTKTPITNLYAVVRTEIMNDSGCPHTLEHLIFLGSEQFPYKGVLDSLANRAGGDGTNAWTADDHTAYTLSTAGTEGILNMLPIYLDHVLYPTLTSAGKVTEVYHVNAKGEDAGVVMSEMQGVENQSSRVMAQRLQLALYPEGSGYRSETGGLQAALRKLTVEEIRDFHKAMYQPHNLCLHLDGSIPLPTLLDILNNKVDPLILSHQPPLPSIPPPNFQRPFLESTSAPGPVVEKDVREVVPFMEKDESVGEVYIGWRGPQSGDFMTELALDILTTYLTDSEIAPLAKEFIEIPAPYCTSIDFATEDRASASELTCSISDVPYAHLDDIADKVKAFLAKLAEKEDVDMDRMKSIIRRDRRKLLAQAETSVTDVLSNAIISDFLYSNADAKDLKRAFDDLKWYDELLEWSASKWIDLLKKYILNNPSVTIVGKPSAELADKIVADDKARVKERVQELGQEGLARKAKELEAAQAENDRDIPAHMITDFPISDATKIDWIPVESAVNPIDSAGKASPRVQAHIDADGDRLPYFVHYSHIESNFIVIRAVIDTTTVPADLKPYLKLYQSSFFGLAVERPDGLLGHEEVVKQLTELTVSYDTGLGIRGDCPELMYIAFKVERDAYDKAIAWLRDLMSKSVFSIDRLQITVAKLIQELPERKRNGARVASSTATSLLFDKFKSASQATGLLNSIEFLPRMDAELKEQPKEVIRKLEELRNHLLEPKGLRVSVAANVLAIPNPRSAWAANFLPAKEVPTAPVPVSRETMSDLGLNPESKGVVVSMGSMEGSYASLYGKGPYGWEHKDLTAVKLAAGVLNALESYFWKRIRGAGLAYGAHVDVEEEYGLVSFRVYRSPDAAKALKAAADCLQGLVDGSIELDENIVNAAKSTMAYSLARQESNVGAAASTVFLNEALKRLPADHGARLLAEVKDVTLDQVRDAFKTWWLPLFSSKSSVVAVAAAPDLADKISDSLSNEGYDVEKRELATTAGIGEDSEDDGTWSHHSGEEEHSGVESGSEAKST